MEFGEFLVHKGAVSQDQLAQTLADQQKSYARMGDILIKKGFLTRDQMAPLLADFFHLPFIDIKKMYKDIPPEVVNTIPQVWAYRLKIIAVDRKDKTLNVAVADPFAIEDIDMLRVVTGCQISCAVALESEILNALEYCYHSASRMKEHVESFIDQETEEGTIQAQAQETEQSAGSPVVDYVKSLMIQALNNDVSDIMIQPKEEAVDLRFRIDGICYDRDPPPKEMFGAIISHIKILAGLNIAEKRLPQDGRFKIKVGDRDSDVRVSTMPTIYGESLVVRLLNSSSVFLSLGDLGFTQAELAEYHRIIRNSYGLILVTGPTGSGKTTTLYSSLKEIESRTKHIITMEDPVEYRMPAITQSQVNKTLNYHFVDGLRTILRQSPDIILVGEIRDRETAEIAIHAALTGHLVFSTLHTNDAASAPVRLINMGVEPYLITSCLLGVIAQRLIRQICPQCRIAYTINDEKLKKEFFLGNETRVYRSKGCEACLETGYKGRRAVYELLVPNDAVHKMILDRSASSEIKEEARRHGMKTMRDNAIRQFIDGQTTLEEVMRLTQEVEG